MFDQQQRQQKYMDSINDSARDSRRCANTDAATTSIIERDIEVTAEHRVRFLFVRLHQTFLVWIGDPLAPVLDNLAVALGPKASVSSTAILTAANASAENDRTMAGKLSVRFNAGRPVYVGYNYPAAANDCELKLSIDSALISFVADCVA